MATKSKGMVEINFNTILTTLIGGIVIWLITSSISTSREQSKSLTKIEVTLPVMDKSITEVKQDVKDVKSTAITRGELDNKHNRLQDAISKVSDRQEKIEERLTRPVDKPDSGNR